MLFVVIIVAALVAATEKMMTLHFFCPANVQLSAVDLFAICCSLPRLRFIIGIVLRLLHSTSIHKHVVCMPLKMI